MATDTVQLSQTKSNEFQKENVLPIAGAHLVHDTYTAAVPALLPVLIEKLSLSLTMVGSLIAILQIPAVLNPFIGYLADKVSLRYFVILAPAVTATLISSLGFTSGYFGIAILLFATGISVACFHAPAPAMIGRLAGDQVGKGMSLFMAAGELARSVGPLLAVWAVSTWTLDGFYRLMFIGWAATLLLYLRLRHVPARMEAHGSFRSMLPALMSFFLPLSLIILFRSFSVNILTVFLPIYVKDQGANLWIAGGALSLLELAGVAGALVSGTVSDILGRRRILFIATIAAAGLMILFVYFEGWILIPLLVMLGFTILSTGPVMLAMVQDQLPNNRAVGNGLYLMMSFLIRPVALVAIGYMGDQFGLEQVFIWSAIVSLLAVPPIFFLPGRSKDSRA
jgi:FSR family fosmidomycin resistance protein-like MFS transporter